MEINTDDYEPIGTFNHWIRDLEEFKTNDKDMTAAEDPVKIPGAPFTYTCL